ncbi:hypothetical protein PHMEG_00041350 [Phytophthora megakarya]|uniref:Uncharacterized protein n=1 Tax=Phytophthora megakarya TaxID=4795 RepID=A0A225UC42_9STRA|nr:hypothetical protein PHMEG_00041350 [Phytophthora megakarya]
MAFLLDEDDGSALEAALSLVDGYSNASPPSHEPSTTSLETDITPSFNVNCMEMSTMVPLSKSMCSNAKFSGFNDEGERPLFKTSKKRNPNKLRDEVQFELVYLRGKVNELETKLRSLQLSSSAKQILQVPRPIPAPRVWEEIAQRQRRQCDVAQHEHAQLKVLVGRKHKKVSGLCETLQKRLHTQNNKYLRVTNVSESQNQSVQVLDFRGDIQDFQGLFQRMEIAYHEGRN